MNVAVTIRQVESFTGMIPFMIIVRMTRKLADRIGPCTKTEHDQEQ